MMRKVEKETEIEILEWLTLKTVWLIDNCDEHKFRYSPVIGESEVGETHIKENNRSFWNFFFFMFCNCLVFTAILRNS